MTAVHDRASIPSAGKAQNTSIQISTSFVGQLLFYVSSTLLIIIIIIIISNLLSYSVDERSSNRALGAITRAFS